MGYLGIIYNNDVRVRPACPQEERGHGRRAEHLAIRQSVHINRYVHVKSAPSKLGYGRVDLVRETRLPGVPPLGDFVLSGANECSHGYITASHRQPIITPSPAPVG